MLLLLHRVWILRVTNLFIATPFGANFFFQRFSNRSWGINVFRYVQRTFLENHSPLFLVFFVHINYEIKSIKIWHSHFLDISTCFGRTEFSNMSLLNCAWKCWKMLQKQEDILNFLVPISALWSLLLLFLSLYFKKRKKKKSVILHVVPSIHLVISWGNNLWYSTRLSNLGNL